MKVPAEQVDFVAVLIYEERPRRRGIEAHVFRAAHPEIAYQCALAKGAEERYGRKFVGLAELAVKTQVTPSLGKTEAGDARDLVVPREQLSAFRDTRWNAVPHDPAELEAALRGPPLLVDLPGLNDVNWGSLSHAYGAAFDVPRDLKRVASSDPDVRKDALWQLGGSIYHQGDIFDATAAAVPFLIALASSPSLPNRVNILELLTAIAESAATKPDAIRKAWADIRVNYPKLIFAKPAEEMAEAVIKRDVVVKAAFDANKGALLPLREETDRKVREAAHAVIRALDG